MNKSIASTLDSKAAETYICSTEPFPMTDMENEAWFPSQNAAGFGQARSDMHDQLEGGIIKIRLHKAPGTPGFRSTPIE